MQELRKIVSYSYHMEEYGRINMKLAAVLKERNITKNALRTLTGVKYDVITRYCKNENIERVDLNVLSKFCYALDCSIADLLEYEKPEGKEAQKKN